MPVGSQRQCPHCKAILEIDSGFHFDEDINLLCDNCEKVIGPVNFSAEPSFAAGTSYDSTKNTNTNRFGHGTSHGAGVGVNNHTQRQHHTGLQN